MDCVDIVRLDDDQLLEHIPERPNLGLYRNRKSTFRLVRS